MNEIKQALLCAALALEIADDCGVENIQCNPPKEWGLIANGEDPEDGWCSPCELAQKLRLIASLIIIEK